MWLSRYCIQYLDCVCMWAFSRKKKINFFHRNLKRSLTLNMIHYIESTLVVVQDCPAIPLYLFLSLPKSSLTMVVGKLLLLNSNFCFSAFILCYLHHGTLITTFLSLNFFFIWLLTLLMSPKKSSLSTSMSFFNSYFSVWLMNSGVSWDTLCLNLLLLYMHSLDYILYGQSFLHLQVRPILISTSIFLGD